MLAAGTGALILFGGRLLPSRAPIDGSSDADAVTSVPGSDIVRGYAVGQTERLRVSAESPLVGVSPTEVRLRQRARVNVITIRRAQGRAARADATTSARDGVRRRRAALTDPTRRAPAAGARAIRGTSP